MYIDLSINAPNVAAYTNVVVVAFEIGWVNLLIADLFSTFSESCSESSVN